MKVDRMTALPIRVIVIIGMMQLSWYQPSYAILKGDNSPFWFVSSRTFLGDLSTWWDADTLGHLSGLPTLTAYSFLWHALQSFARALWRKNYRYGKTSRKLVKTGHYHNFLRRKARFRKIGLNVGNLGCGIRSYLLLALKGIPYWLGYWCR